jgi:acyl-coenzyme A thioesterase PaaI-like protein
MKSVFLAAQAVMVGDVEVMVYKVNCLRPAGGERLLATAVTESSGSRLVVCRCEVLSIEGENQSRCAVGQGTIALPDCKTSGCESRQLTHP